MSALIRMEYRNENSPSHNVDIDRDERKQQQRN